MALITVLLYLVVIYARPGEVISGWEGFPFAAIFLAVSSVALVVSLVMRPRRFWNQPHDRYVLGFFAAILLSNPSWGWFGGVMDPLKIMTPTVLCYFLIRGSVRSARDLRWAGYTLAALTAFQAVSGVLQYRGGIGLGSVAALEYKIGESEEDVEEEPGPETDAPPPPPTRPGDAKPNTVRRIRGTGIFNDPNDLAMAFVVAVPFLLGPLVRRGSTLRARALAAVLLVPILVALFYTNSRGGVLGLGAVLVSYCWRFGKGTGTVMAVATVTALLALAPSRMNQMDSQESSAQGRVQSWSEGLQMFKSRPVLGVGFGRYTEFNDLVAHNSFVHTLGELGVVGAFCFAGMVYWLFRGIGGAGSLVSTSPELDRLLRWGDDLRSGCLGWCVSAAFLSRQYNVVIFIWLAMSACYYQVLQGAGATPRREGLWDVAIIGAATVGGVVVVYVIVTTFAVWGA